MLHGLPLRSTDLPPEYKNLGDQKQAAWDCTDPSVQCVVSQLSEPHVLGVHIPAGITMTLTGGREAAGILIPEAQRGRCRLLGREADTGSHRCVVSERSAAKESCLGNIRARGTKQAPVGLPPPLLLLPRFALWCGFPHGCRQPKVSLVSTFIKACGAREYLCGSLLRGWGLEGTSYPHIPMELALSL